MSHPAVPLPMTRALAQTRDGTSRIPYAIGISIWMYVFMSISSPAQALKLTRKGIALRDYRH